MIYIIHRAHGIQIDHALNTSNANIYLKILKRSSSLLGFRGGGAESCATTKNPVHRVQCQAANERRPVLSRARTHRAEVSAVGEAAPQAELQEKQEEVLPFVNEPSPRSLRGNDRSKHARTHAHIRTHTYTSSKRESRREF